MNETILGLVGLGTMGRNLAENLIGKGVSVYWFDTNKFESNISPEGSMCIGFSRLEDLVNAIPRPRKICILIPSGAAVRSLVNNLILLLSPGDVLIDAGNSYYKDTSTLQSQTSRYGVELVGLGISGGAKGARSGPSMMAGGDITAVEMIEEIMSRAAAKAHDGTACFLNVGTGSSGHFVKMVHNGIEYADMQCISEAVHLLRSNNRISLSDTIEALKRWNGSRNRSYLLEAAIAVLSAKDEVEEALIDKIDDVADDNGTGRWAAVTAIELGVPAPTIVEAVNARSVSRQKQIRKLFQTFVCSQNKDFISNIEKDLEVALYCARSLILHQGFSLVAAGSCENNWAINLDKLAKIWSNGTIIKSELLNTTLGKYEKNKVGGIISDDRYRKNIEKSIGSLRKVIGIAIENGIPVPGMQSCLTLWDEFSSEKLWTNLIQGQRDYFGAHGFKRIDTNMVTKHKW